VEEKSSDEQTQQQQQQRRAWLAEHAVVIFVLREFFIYTLPRGLIPPTFRATPPDLIPLLITPIAHKGVLQYFREVGPWYIYGL